MSNFIKEYDTVGQSYIKEIKKYVDKDKRKYETSQMYSQKLDEKFIDKEIRSSVFKNFEIDNNNDSDTNQNVKNLFDVFKHIVDDMNSVDKFDHYKLITNDISHIKYEKGGFFKAHDDYVSLKSNIMSEFTLVLCLDADCDGGRTIFHVNKHFTYCSESSKNTGQNGIIS